MKILVNYANEPYRRAQKLQSLTGKFIARFDRILEFGPEDIDEAFRQTHERILSYPRGNGLWLWKPYFLNRVISECHDGDIVFYLDSGAYFIRNPKPLYDCLNDENPVFVTDVPLLESNFTKPSCIEAMHGEAFLDTHQIQATYILLRVTAFTRAFVKEYLRLCAETDLLLPEGANDLSRLDHDYGTAFVAHREDQSVLSLLCKKHGIQAHRDISQRGTDPESYYNPHYAYSVPSHPHDTYKSIVFLHKNRTTLLQYLRERMSRKLTDNHVYQMLRNVKHRILTGKNWK